MKTTLFFVSLLLISASIASSISEPEKNASHHSADDAGHLHANVNGTDVQHHHEGHHGVSLASWRWNLYSEYIIVCLTIMIAGALKLLFHHTHILSKNVPESVRLVHFHYYYFSILSPPSITPLFWGPHISCMSLHLA